MTHSHPIHHLLVLFHQGWFLLQSSHPTFRCRKDRREETARKSNVECVRSEPENPQDFESYWGLRSENKEARGTETTHLSIRGCLHSTPACCVCVCVCVCVRLVTQSWLILVTPWTVAGQSPLFMGIFQTRMLEWVAMPSSRGSSQPRDEGQVSRIVSEFFTARTTRKAQEYGIV